MNPSTPIRNVTVIGTGSGGAHPEREGVLRREFGIPGANWHQIAFQPTDDPALAPFGESFDLMGDRSMLVLPTRGHLPGSISMLVGQSESPPLLFIGDLTSADELLERDQIPVTGDKKQPRESFAKVRSPKERMPGLIILPAHDPSAVEKLSALQKTLQPA